MKDIKLVKAKTKDLKRVAELYQEGFGSAPYNEAWTMKTAIKRVKFHHDTHEVYVALKNSKVIAFIISTREAWINGDRGIIIELVVQKEFQKQGIGKMLVEQIEKEYKKKGVKTMFVESMDETSEYFKKFKYIPAWNVMCKELK